MRIKNSIKNIYFGILTQFIIIICMFLTRTVFIKTLGKDYLGISGLFTNILTIFSLAELGVSQAINYHLYRLIAENNQEKISSIMIMYKKIYTKIAIFILVFGITLTPLIHNFIRPGEKIDNLQIIYILFVINSAASYLFIYKSTLIIAMQKNYIISRINYVVLIGTSIIQILAMYIFKNYIIYLIIQILSIIIQNTYISIKADKLYPYLKNKETIQLLKDEKKFIFKDIKILLLYKIGTISLNSTDNIIMAKFVDLSSVAIFSNYNLIVGAVNTFISTIFSSLTASIGNLGVEEDRFKKEFIFKVISFASFWIYSVCSVELIILLNPFINIWLGESFLMNQFTVLLIIINFYISGMLFVPFTFRQTLGLFRYGKYRPIISALLNLVISIILVRKIGVVGILLGTLITRLLTNVWFDPYIVYKKGFNLDYKFYFKIYIKYFIILILMILTNSLIIYIDLVSINNIIISSIIIFLVSNFIIILIFNKTEEFDYLMDVLRKNILNKLRGKNNEKI